jgi:hypothetical protein
LDGILTDAAGAPPVPAVTLSPAQTEVKAEEERVGASK